MKLTAEWECPNGHVNSVTVESYPPTAQNLIEIMSNFESDTHLDCYNEACEGGRHTDIYWLSNEEYVQGVIDASYMP